MVLTAHDTSADTDARAFATDARPWNSVTGATESKSWHVIAGEAETHFCFAQTPMHNLTRARWLHMHQNILLVH